MIKNPFTAHIDVDSFLPATNLTPQYVPIDSWNTNLSVGLNFTVGAYHGRFPKLVK